LVVVTVDKETCTLVMVVPVVVRNMTVQVLNVLDQVSLVKVLMVHPAPTQVMVVEPVVVEPVVPEVTPFCLTSVVTVEMV
jgi:hypothetical protein